MALTVAESQEGMTPLHAAACAGNVRGLRALVRAGAKVHSQSDTGGTPLHYALMTQKLISAVFLVEEAHADVNFQAFVRLAPHG